MGIEDLKKAFPFPAAEPDVPASDHGWFGPENERLLKGALSPGIKVVLELGSWLGKSTRFIAGAAPSAVVVSIDHWYGSAEHKVNQKLKAVLPVLYETFLKNCWLIRDRIVPLRSSTVPGMRLVRDYGVSPDLVYVDASHDYQSVRADILVSKELFPDAALCGDDFTWPGVRQAVEELVDASIDGNVWWKKGPAFD